MKICSKAQLTFLSLLHSLTAKEKEKEKESKSFIN